MSTSEKVIVTNRQGLRSKHGNSGMKKIDRAIASLIKADAKRGVTTRLVAIDRKSDMKGIGKPVTRQRIDGRRNAPSTRSTITTDPTTWCYWVRPMSFPIKA